MTDYRELKPEDITAELLEEISKEFPREEFCDEELSDADLALRRILWFCAPPLH